MANNLKLWINAETGRLLSSGSSFVTATPHTFHAGDTLSLELHLIAGAGVARSPYEIAFPAGASVKVAVGTVAKNPLGGQWRLSVDSTETSDLSFDAAASAVETALNALSAVSTQGGVAVSALGGGYSITWNTVGTKPSILSGSDTLTPSSYESILVLQAGDVSTREIVFVELRQTPLALATSFAPIGSPSVSTSTVSAWNTVNQVIRVNLINSPKSGFWTLTLVNGIKTYVAAIQVGASSNDVRNAILSSLSGGSDFGQVGTVTQTDQGQYDIVLTRNFTASVAGTGLVASDALVGNISFATSELIAFLGNLASAQASLEISVESDSKTKTYVQVLCAVANAVVAAGAVGPVPIGTLLTEDVANARFIRQDVASAPSGATQDIIWQNLGVTLDGSDTVAALNNAASPSSGNPFATMSDVGANPFDQDLNTTDSPAFVGLTLSGQLSSISEIYTSTQLAALGTSSGEGVFVAYNGITMKDSSAVVKMQYGLNEITFADATTQNTRVVRESQATGAPGIDQTYYPYEVKVVDSSGTEYWVVARLA